MSVSDLTTGEENFWPSITQTSDGQVYVVTNFPAIIRVDGLDTLQRLPPQTINLTPQILEQARSYLGSEELGRQEIKTANRGLDGTGECRSRERSTEISPHGTQSSSS